MRSRIKLFIICAKHFRLATGHLSRVNNNHSFLNCLQCVNKLLLFPSADKRSSLRPYVTHPAYSETSINPLGGQNGSVDRPSIKSGQQTPVHICERTPNDRWINRYKRSLKNEFNNTSVH